MTEISADATIHNGWFRFEGQKTTRKTEDLVFWGFSLSDRKTIPVVYDRFSEHPWRDARIGGALMKDDIDFLLPFSSFTPPPPDRQVFRNPLPVVVLLVRSRKGLIAIRRALADGYGQIAIPGGYHNHGETWQEAACREFVEETGVVLDPGKVRIYDVVTVQNGGINLVFGIYEDIVESPVFSNDNEVLEVLELSEAVETAFPAHTDIMARYMASSGYDNGQYAVAAR